MMTSFLIITISFQFPLSLVS